MFAINSKLRLIAGLLGVFITNVSFYAILDWLFPSIATAATVVLAGCTVIYFMYRWREKPPQYDHEIRELRALALLSPLMKDNFLPLSQTWSMEPEALVDIVNHIQINDCKVIVECGSGVSTILIGNLLKQRNRGQLYALEDDKDWHDFLSGILSKQELNRYVTLVYAPLKPFPGSIANTSWYDTERANLALNTVSSIDLLIVDGPKSVNELSRAPALSFFESRINGSSLIILDDANRSMERGVLDRWQQEFNITIVRQSETCKGQAYIQFSQKTARANYDRS